MVEAFRCTVEIQHEMVERNRKTPEDERIRFRIGINVGDVMEQDGDLLGDGVNVAARLQEIAEPGGVSISDMVHQQIEDKVDSAFENAGKHQVKNMVRPIHVWRWEGEGSPAPPRGPDLSKPPPLPDKPSIAVLSFENMSTDPEQEYFSDGIAEDIITSLSKLSQLMVIARNSTFAYKGRPAKVQEIAEELGVRYVVEGSVRKAGNRVRITAQLIDCTTGAHVWADRFDRELTDIFAVQDEVTREIVSAMALTLTADEQGRLEHKSTNNLKAFDYYLRGREHHWLLSREGSAHAKAMFNRAIDLDPEFAPAYAFLSIQRVLDHINQWHDANDRPLEHAYELAERAVLLDDTYARSHFTLGNANLWKR